MLAHQPQHAALGGADPAMRNRAQTLRWPSPWNGLPARTARIASTSAVSGIGPEGPRRRGGSAGEAARGGGRPSSARRARPGTPGRARTACRRRGSGPAHRLDLRRAKGRGHGLQGGDLLGQQLALEQHLAQPGLQPLALQRLAVGRPGRQAASPAARKASRQPGASPPSPPARARPLQVLAPKQPQHGLPLARPGHPPAPARSDRIRRSRRHGPPPLRTRSAYGVSRSTVGRGTVTQPASSGRQSLPFSRAL